MAYTPARRRAGKKTPMKPKKTRPSNANVANVPGEGPTPSVPSGATAGWGQVNIVRGPNGAKFDCPPKSQYGRAGVVTITSECIEIVDTTGQ